MKISNVSRSASVQDIKEFFSFSGDIVYIEMQRSVLTHNVRHLCTFLSDAYAFVTLPCPFCSVDESSLVAYVTFKDSQGAETALLLTVCWYLHIGYSVNKKKKEFICKLW